LWHPSPTAAAHRQRVVPPRASSTPDAADKRQELDPIERFVASLFGQKALEDQAPAGMKRLSEQDSKELYPATTDSFADPLPGDPPEVAIIRPLLKDTQLEKAPLRLAYDANVHGWSSAMFHRGVDTFGAGLVIATTTGGAVVGGYNPRGWIGLGEDRDAVAAFLFTWPEGTKKKRPIKLPKVGGPSLAVVDKPDNGIQFGAEGLKIPLIDGQEKVVKCRLGTFYSNLPDGSRTLFSLTESPKSTELTELKVYVAVGQGEAWELDGIIWKTSSVQ